MLFAVCFLIRLNKLGKFLLEIVQLLCLREEVRFLIHFQQSNKLEKRDAHSINQIVVKHVSLDRVIILLFIR
jgi:hypothetical protein